MQASVQTTAQLQNEDISNIDNIKTSISAKSFAGAYARAFLMLFGLVLFGLSTPSIQASNSTPELLPFNSEIRDNLEFESVKTQVLKPISGTEVINRAANPAPENSPQPDSVLAQPKPISTEGTGFDVNLLDALENRLGAHLDPLAVYRKGAGRAALEQLGSGAFNKSTAASLLEARTFKGLDEGELDTSVLLSENVQNSPELKPTSKTAIFRFNVADDPALIRRASISYSLEGANSFIKAKRSINGSPMQGGLVDLKAIPQASAATKDLPAVPSAILGADFIAANTNQLSTQSETFSPILIQQGVNEISFELPLEAAIADVKLDLDVAKAANVLSDAKPYLGDVPQDAQAASGAALLFPKNLLDGDTTTAETIELGVNQTWSSAFVFDARQGVSVVTLEGLTDPTGNPLGLDAFSEVQVFGAFKRDASTEGSDPKLKGSNAELGEWIAQPMNKAFELIPTSNGTTLRMMLNQTPVEALKIEVRGPAVLPENGYTTFELAEISAIAAPKTPNLAVTFPSADGEVFGHTTYVRGFVEPFDNGSGAVKLTLGGRPIRHFYGQFEAAFTYSEEGNTKLNADGSWNADLVAYYPDGKTVQKTLRLNHSETSKQGLFLAKRDGAAALLDPVVKVGEAKTLKTDGAELVLGENALAHETSFEIKPVSGLELPPFLPDFKPLTVDGLAYRFLPHGQKFLEPVEIRLAIDQNQLAGLDPSKVKTYFFNEQISAWTEVETIGVDLETGFITAKTDHFTNYVSGVISEPETPKQLDFNPNLISGLEAANPSAGINLIAPPSPAPSGDAVLAYPLELPAGRAGMAPSFALTYKSSRGQGVLGQGWDLPLNAITVENFATHTSFSASKESETYTIIGPVAEGLLGDGNQASLFNNKILSDGVQLTPNFKDGVQNRQANRKFRVRINNSMATLIRHGSSPSTYWWELKETSGMRHAFGGAFSADGKTGSYQKHQVVRHGNNVLQWPLLESRDTFGNTVSYTYSISKPAGPITYVTKEMLEEEFKKTQAELAQLQAEFNALKKALDADIAAAQSDINKSPVSAARIDQLRGIWKRNCERQRSRPTRRSSGWGMMMSSYGANSSQNKNTLQKTCDEVAEANLATYLARVAPGLLGQLANLDAAKAELAEAQNEHSSSADDLQTELDALKQEISKLPPPVNLTGQKTSAYLIGADYTGFKGASGKYGVKFIYKDKAMSGGAATTQATNGFAPRLALAQVAVNYDDERIRAYAFGYGSSRDASGKWNSVLRTINQYGSDGHATWIGTKFNTHTLSYSANDVLLTKIERPLGATIDISYANAAVGSSTRKVLTHVKTHDGHAGDGVDTTWNYMVYRSPRFDAAENKFYGFYYYVNYERDTQANKWYRYGISYFLNRSYYEQGRSFQDRLYAYSPRQLLSLNSHGFWIYNDKPDGTRARLGRAAQYSMRNETLSILPYYTRNYSYAYGIIPEVGEEAIYTEEDQEDKTTRQYKLTGANFYYDKYNNVKRYLGLDTYAPGNTWNSKMWVDSSIAYDSDPAAHIFDRPKQINVRDGYNRTIKRKRAAAYQKGTGALLSMSAYSGAQVSTSNYAYDKYGNINFVTGPANHKGQRSTLDIEYDPQTNSFATKLKDQFGLESHIAYDLRFDLELEQVDPNGAKISHQYDIFGRKISVTAPLEQGLGTPTIAYNYHPDASTPWALTANYDAFNPNDPIETETYIDGVGRIIQVKKDGSVWNPDIKKSEGVKIVSGHQKYDSFGRITESYYPVTETYLLNQGMFNSTTDTVAPTKTDYDTSDRPIKVTAPNGATNSYAYSFAKDDFGRVADLTRVTNSLGYPTDTYTNERGLITTIHQYKKGNAEGLAGFEGVVRTRYTYDALNQLTNVTDHKGNNTISTYDGFGNRTSYSNVDTGKVTYEFDPAGNLIKKTNANGSYISSAYDYTRIAEKQIRNPATDVAQTPAATDKVRNYLFRDATGTAISTYLGKGPIATGGGRKITYSYGQPKTEDDTQAANQPAATQSGGYGEVNNRLTVGAKSVSYQADIGMFVKRSGNGKVAEPSTKTSTPTIPAIAKFSGQRQFYNAGRLIKVTGDGGTTYAYDALGNKIKTTRRYRTYKSTVYITTGREPDGDNGTKEPDTRRTVITSSIQAANENQRYDSFGRLFGTVVTGGGSYYGYDSGGKLSAAYSNAGFGNAKLLATRHYNRHGKRVVQGMAGNAWATWDYDPVSLELVSQSVVSPDRYGSDLNYETYKNTEQATTEQPKHFGDRNNIDPMHMVVSYKPNLAGQLMSREFNVRSVDSFKLETKETYQYDSLNQLISSSGFSEFDPKGLKTQTNATGFAVSFSNSNSMDSVRYVGETSAKAETEDNTRDYAISYAYDEIHNLTSKTWKTQTRSNQKTGYSVFKLRNVFEGTSHRVKESFITQPVIEEQKTVGWNKTLFLDGAANREYHSFVNLNDVSDAGSTQDAKTVEVSTGTFLRDASGNFLRSDFKGNRLSTYTYDARGLPTSVVGADYKDVRRAGDKKYEQKDSNGQLIYASKRHYSTNRRIQTFEYGHDERLRTSATRMQNYDLPKGERVLPSGTNFLGKYLTASFGGSTSHSVYFGNELLYTSSNNNITFGSTVIRDGKPDEETNKHRPDAISFKSTLWHVPDHLGESMLKLSHMLQKRSFYKSSEEYDCSIGNPDKNGTSKTCVRHNYMQGFLPNKWSLTIKNPDDVAWAGAGYNIGSDVKSVRIPNGSNGYIYAKRVQRPITRTYLGYSKFGAHTKNYAISMNREGGLFGSFALNSTGYAMFGSASCTGLSAEGVNSAKTCRASLPMIGGRVKRTGVRFYRPTFNRWLTPDPILNTYLNGKTNGGVYNPINLNLYAYAANNPVMYKDTDGRSTDPNAKPGDANNCNKNPSTCESDSGGSDNEEEKDTKVAMMIKQQQDKAKPKVSDDSPPLTIMSLQMIGTAILLKKIKEFNSKENATQSKSDDKSSKSKGSNKGKKGREGKKGGGKTGRKNPKNIEDLKAKLADARKRKDKADSVPNKTKADKQAVDRIKREINRLIERIRKSEPHGIDKQ